MALHVQSSLNLPPICRLGDSVTPNIIAAFLGDRVRGWNTVPAALSTAARAALWVLLALNAAMGAWLLAVHAGSAVCSGLLCTIVTLGGHPSIAFGLTLTCAATLVVTMPITRGFTRSSGPMLGVVTTAALCGLIAIAGVVAVLFAVALCLAMALGVLFVVIDRL